MNTLYDCSDESVYDGYSEDSVKEIEGITDKVTDLPYTNLSYPAIIFKDGLRLPTHKVTSISNMVKSSAGSAKKDITLYYQNGGDLYKMGMLSGQQIDSLLSIVPRDQIDAYYDDGSKLEGGKIFVLCNFSY